MDNDIDMRDDGEPAAEEKPQMLGGEIRIVADKATGVINISAPGNMIIALGMIEIGKAILIKQQHDAQAAAQQPKILRGDPSRFPLLTRPS